MSQHGVDKACREHIYIYMYKVFILKTLIFFLVKFLHAFPQEDRLNEMNLAELY